MDKQLEEPTTINDMTKIYNLKKKLQKIHQDIYRKRREINRLSNKINETEKILYDTCSHKWVLDKSDDGCYGSSWHVCAICSLDRSYFR